MCATALIEDCRICYLALADISAEKLPVSLKIRALGMNCAVPDNNQQRNTYTLEKIMEFKPTSINVPTNSYKTWPRNNEQWSQTMLSWSKGKLPKLKSANYSDIDLPSDLMTNVVSKREFPYYPSDSGNSIKSHKQKQNPQKQNVSGLSGRTVWDFINHEENY